MEYQDYLEQKASKRFGFRNWAVRAYNQVSYSLFGDHTTQVIEGEDGYLFESGYIHSICGKDFLGHDLVQSKVDSLVRFQQWLRDRDKALIVIIAPNKWRYHQDKVDRPCESITERNYEAFIGALRKTDVTVMDWMIGFEHTQPKYPLFSRQGTHWSIYGASIAANALNKVMLRQELTDVELELESFQVTSQARNTDKDLHELLNVLEAPKAEELAYPSFSANGDQAPRALVVGDSYYWTFYYLGLHEKLFAPGSKFLYYNRTMVGATDQDRSPLDDEVRKAELDQSDVVILVMSEPSLKWFGYGLLSQASKD